MASYSWIKLYQDILNDPKMGRLSDSAFRRCIQLFLLAGEEPERDGRLPSIADAAWVLRVSDEQMAQDWSELEQAGIVALANGCPVVVNFEKRQQALTGTERSRESRKRSARLVGTMPLEKEAEEDAATQIEQSRDEGKTAVQQNGNGTATAVLVECNEDATIRCLDQIRSDKDHVCSAREATAGLLSVNAGLPDEVWQMITAVSDVTKTTYWDKTAADFEDAAYALIGYDATPQEVRGFREWWAVNSWYDDDSLPQLHHLVNSWKSYKAGVTRRPKPNGTAPKPIPSVGLVEIEPGVY
jgi:DNA-binding transcriptional regulator YhcF (GntR family)